MTQDLRDHKAPYASRTGYLVPFASLALSLPTLVTVVGLGSVALYHALTGYTLAVSTPPLLQSPLAFAAMVCYLVLGPMLGAILCLTQRTRAEQRYGSALLLGYQMKRLNTLALCSAALAIAALMLLVVAGMLLRSGT